MLPSFTALPQTYAAWPVWSDSTTQTIRFQPMPKKAATRLWHRARDFDRRRTSLAAMAAPWGTPGCRSCTR